MNNCNKNVIPSYKLNVTRMQFVKDHTLYTALRQCWTVSRCQNDIWLFGSFVYFDWWPDALPGVNS